MKKYGVMKTSPPPELSEIKWFGSITDNPLTLLFNLKGLGKRLTVHEAGHILVGALGPERIDLDYAEIMPFNIKGITYFTRGQINHTAAELPMLYAGTAAEVIVFGNAFRQYGSANGSFRGNLDDFSKADYIAAKQTLGPESLGELKDHVGFFQGFSMPKITQEMLPEGMGKVDALKKIYSLKSEAYSLAWNILAENRTALERIADTFLEKKRITGSEVRQILENEL